MKYSLLASIFALGIALASPQSGLAQDQLSEPKVTLGAAGITLEINFKAEAKLQLADRSSRFTALSEVPGLRMTGSISADLTQQGAAKFTRMMRRDGDGASCAVTDRFSMDRDAIRWDVSIEGVGAAFGADVVSSVVTPTPENSVYWTTWGGPKSDEEVKKALR